MISVRTKITKKSKYSIVLCSMAMIGLVLSCAYCLFLNSNNKKDNVFIIDDAGSLKMIYMAHIISNSIAKYEVVQYRNIDLPKIDGNTKDVPLPIYENIDMFKDTTIVGIWNKINIIENIDTAIRMKNVKYYEIRYSKGIQNNFYTLVAKDIYDRYYFLRGLNKDNTNILISEYLAPLDTEYKIKKAINIYLEAHAPEKQLSSANTLNAKIEHINFKETKVELLKRSTLHPNLMFSYSFLLNTDSIISWSWNELNNN